MSHKLELKNFNEVIKNILPDIAGAVKSYYDILYDISTTIFLKRKEMNMSQKEFADLLGVSQVMVSKYEGGDYNFTIEKLCDVAEKLNLIPEFAFYEKTTPQHEFDYSNATIADTLNGLANEYLKGVA